MACITAIATCIPATAPVLGAASATRARAYSYLYEASARDAVPFSRQDLLFAPQPDLAAPAYAAHAPAPGSRVPVAAADVTATGLAEAACRDLAAGLAAPALARVRQLVFCHDTIDEAIVGSTAAALQSTLNLPAALPFSLGQFSNCSVFLAFELAAALGDAVGEATVIAAADKWIFPFLRGFGPHACLGDAAAAALVLPGSDQGLHIEAVATRRCAHELRAYSSRPFPSWPGFAADVAETVADCLASAGAAASDVDLVVPQGFAAVLCAAVARESGLAGVAHHDGPVPAAHLANADPLCRLHGLLGAGAPAGRTILLWGAGMNGESAAALLRRAGPVAPLGAA